MNINDIINEETEKLVKEIATGADSRIPTYQYHKASEGRFVIDVNEPQKNIRANFDVTFSPEGNREEKAYSIAFKESGGNYSEKTGMGVQFRLLATITKIVKEQVAIYDPNILTFQPVKESGESGNRRLSLYMNYVKGGAGEDFDAFILGNKQKVNVEKRNPSFEIKNGYQEPQIIQDIITQLSVYNGYYQTDLYPDDPDYEKFGISSWGGMYMQSKKEGTVSTMSARRLVDWMFSIPDLVYIQGSNEPEPYEVPREPRRDTGTVDAPIQRVTQPQEPTAMIGTFQYFLQSEIYGNPEYEILEPFFETVKSYNDFLELRSRAQAGLNVARTTSDSERLREIINAIDNLKRNYNEYADRYGSNVNEDEILNEVELKLLELLK